MGIGVVLEPFVVVTLLFGGTYINRNKSYKFTWKVRPQQHPRPIFEDAEDVLPHSPDSWASEDGLLDRRRSTDLQSPSLLAVDADPRWRTRELRLWRIKKDVVTPNSLIFKDRLFSRVIRKGPFLQEAFYWALIYWVYQIGRGVNAITLVEGTVHVARKHALQLIQLEQYLHIFWELGVQRFFLQYPTLLTWINRIYSFIHIPGTILFLVCLYHSTTPRGQQIERRSRKGFGEDERNAARPANFAGPELYEARRRTMAMCNLIAFIIFTFWPCMPPRLLSDKNVTGPSGHEARRYGFVDTVHGEGGEGSVWTQNKFCNQYAAMPSLHFGYSLLIGLTILNIPRSPCQKHSKAFSFLGLRFHVSIPNVRHAACITAGILYPLIIFIAIIATANHFILDAVAGAIVCGVAWHGHDILLNLLPLEDWFLWCIGLHFPGRGYD